MAEPFGRGSTGPGNLNYMQDLIDGFGNLPLGYAQGAFTLQDLADYVFPAAYEKIDTSTFNPEATAALLDQIMLQATGSEESKIYVQAKQLVADVAAGTVDPDLAASTLLLTEEGQQLSMMNPALGDVLSGVMASARKMGEDTRALQTGDVVQFDDGFYRRRTDKERNDLLADVGLDNALSNPDLYGFEKRQRELSGVDRFIDRFAAQEADATLQGGNAAKRLAEAESVMAAFLDQQEAERAGRPGSRAATGVRRPVQNAGTGVSNRVTPYQQVQQRKAAEEAAMEQARVAGLSPYQITQAGRDVRRGESPAAQRASESRTVTSPPPYTDADLRRLRDEARDLENRQKMAKAQREQQEMVRAALEMNQGRYQAPAQRLLTDGFAQMGASVAGVPKVSKPKIRLTPEQIDAILR